MPSEVTKCSNCGSDEIDYDPARGDAACVACGTVVQQSLIVNEVAFQEDARGRSNMVGQHVGADGQPSGRSVLPGHSPAATYHTMTNAKRHIFQIASQLGLSSSTAHIDQAVRLYRLAVERNFHRGRRVVNLSCACLYIICRLERTPHMLLDFADVSKTNVFTLGHVFLKLVRLLEIQLPLIDPSLYMHRFASKLEFGDMQNAVAMTALRIAARMQRDWLTHGRRPAGLCGAALLTASVMHNFYRSTAEVARVVRIGNVVLRNRLREFDRTHTASMTAEQIDAGGGDDGKKASLKPDTLGEETQPPSFIRNQEKKKAEQEAKLAALAKKKGAASSGKDASNEQSQQSKSAGENNKNGKGQASPAAGAKNATKRKERDKPLSEERRKELEENERSKKVAADSRVDSLMAEAMASDEMQALDHESDIAHKLSKETASKQKKKRKKRKRKVQTESKDTEGGSGNGENEADKGNGGESNEKENGDGNGDGNAKGDDTANGDGDGDGDSDDSDSDEEYDDDDDDDNNEGCEKNNPIDDGEILDENTTKEDLSDLDDEDCMKYISTEEEFKVKEQLWTETNKDYLEKQARLEVMKRERPEEYRRLRPGGGKKRKSDGLGGSKSGTAAKRKTLDSESEPPAPRRVSKKLNYQVLQTLEDGGDDTMVDY